jgi:hypothetical protein
MASYIQLGVVLRRGHFRTHRLSAPLLLTLWVAAGTVLTTG